MAKAEIIIVHYRGLIVSDHCNAYNQDQEI